MVGKNFKFMVLIFLENTLKLGIFTHAHLPSQSSPRRLLKSYLPKNISKFITLSIEGKVWVK